MKAKIFLYRKSRLLLLLATALCFLIAAPSGPQDSPSFPRGASRTLLPDGRWLIAGGEGQAGPLSSAQIWDASTGQVASLPAGLQNPRAWHSATILPDGTIFVFGGIGVRGATLASAEVFDPSTQTFESVTSTGLTARSKHTATLLTDGSLLIAGGLSAAGKALNTAELWDFESGGFSRLRAKLTDSRYSHSARLLPDGRVLLSGGVGERSQAETNGEIFDPSSEAITSIALQEAERLKLQTRSPQVAASSPADGAVDVPIDHFIAIRFSEPLRVDSLNSDSIVLSGPEGIEEAAIVPAEEGMLAFIVPKAPLLSLSTYTVTLNGPVDNLGLLLPVTSFNFNTESIAGSGSASVASSKNSKGSSTEDTKKAKSESGDDDGFVWKGALKDGKPHSPYQDLPPKQAEAGVTGLAGQVLDLSGEPLVDVTLEISYDSYEISVKTDVNGQFLLKGLTSGRRQLIIDGRPAHTKDAKSKDTQWGYGLFEYGLEIAPDVTNILPFTIWLPKIDSKHAAKISSPASRKIIVKTPYIRDLEVHIPAGTVIRDYEGETVNEVSITRVPEDRPPFPLPNNVFTPALFTIQPGLAYVYGSDGVSLVYPNYSNNPQPPASRFNFWHYDPEGSGWSIYGQGTVTPDGKQVVPDAGVRIYEFTGAMINGPDSPGPPTKCKGVGGCTGGDPVDLSTGTFVMEKTDLFLPDVMPLKLTRTYVSSDTNQRAFGSGMTHPYRMFLWSAQQYQQADLILPNQARIHYVRTTSGTGFADAVFEHRGPNASCSSCVGSPTSFYGSVIRWNGGGWDLTLKDGTVYVLGENAPLQAIRDRNGNQITITRDGGGTGNITQITSPNGRWISFTYDAGSRITQAKDNLGRTVTYTYVSGRLSTVTDPNGGVTTYTYDASNRMATLKDPKNIVYLTNEYYTDGKVKKQTQADATTYQFTYTTDGSGNVTQTDLTDPRGKVRRVTFNTDGQILSDTSAFGTADQQATTYVLQSATNLVLSKTDALSRKTSFTYNAMGNTTSITRLADTADAVTTTYTYEPAFNQIATITDPLNHTTTFGYDNAGNLTTITNALNQSTTIAYNGSGQPTSITDPLNHTTQLTYELGDLLTVTDPLGNVTTRIPDPVGRLLSVTNPLGNTTSYTYDTLNRLTQVTDPIGGVTQLGYDANGNLLSVTDARSNATAYTYNNMDRLSTRTDPLLHVETYNTYDNNGNLTQFTDRKSQVTNYTYDSLNRRTAVTYADTSTTTYTYDAGNRLTQIADSLSGTITRTYDGLDRLTSETTPQGTVSYTYDNAGRRATMTVSGQTDTIYYTYDNANRLTQITQGTSTVSFSYDAAGRRTSLTLPNNVVTEYGYDAASRVTSITYKLGTTVLGDLTYQYDKAGNRISVDGTWARTGIPQAVATTNYDNGNRQLTFGDKTLAYDINGNLTSIVDGSGTTLYTWNARNQLAGISGPGVSASFAYDGSGRREQKTVNSSLTEFLYDGINPIQESSGATVLANALTGFAPDEFFTRADSSGSRISLQDALGSILALTDSAGVVQSQSTYDPYGNATASGIPIPYQYTGRENDSTGLYYYRARYYNPQIGRFISEDPLDFAGGDVNLYAYVGNNPINRIDPLGLDWVDDAADYSAGFGDSMTFGLTNVIRGYLGSNTAVNKCGGWYKFGEYSETGLEAALTLGSAFLKKAAAQASKAAARAASDRLTQGIIRNGKFVHHINPLFGHPGGASTMFPLGGLPPWVHSGAWNLELLTAAEHTAAHRYLRALEQGIGDLFNPLSTALRGMVNVARSCGCD